MNSYVNDKIINENKKLGNGDLLIQLFWNVCINWKYKNKYISLYITWINSLAISASPLLAATWRAVSPFASVLSTSAPACKE